MLSLNRSRARRSPDALRRWRALAGVVLLALLVVPQAGCLLGETLGDPLNRRHDFEDTSKQFIQYIRWGDIEQASVFVVPELREDFLALATHMNDLRITNFEVVHSDLKPGLVDAEVDVLYSGYRLSNPVERSVMINQFWHKDEVAGWQVRLDVARLRQRLENPPQ